MFSRAAGRESAADKCHWRVWGALAVFRPHWVCPRSRVCPFPVYTAQAAGSSTGCGPWVACTCQAQTSQVQVLRSSTKTQTWLGLHFVLSPVSSSGNQELDERTLLRCSATSPLPGPACFWAPCVSSGELISGCDLPGRCQPSRISGSLWLETGSLFAVW